jgi:hypothetical protein
MAIECLTVVRAFRATVHHAAHRLAGHYLHHAHHAVVKGIVSHAAKLPVVVCVATGLAAIGGGGLIANGRTAGPSAPRENGGTTNPALSLVTNGTVNLLTSLIGSLPNHIGGSPDTPFPYNWGEASNLSESPSTPAWSEIGSPAGTWPSPVWHEIDNFREITSSLSPSEASTLSGTPSQPGAVPEPASISVLVAGLCVAAVLYRRSRTRPVAPAGGGASEDCPAARKISPLPESGQSGGHDLLVGSRPPQNADVAGELVHAGDKVGCDRHDVFRCCRGLRPSRSVSPCDLFPASPVKFIRRRFARTSTDVVCRCSSNCLAPRR